MLTETAGFCLRTRSFCTISWDGMPKFYFAIGGRSSQHDLSIAIAVGQRHFLVPAGSAMAERLRSLSDVHVVLDSGAWPPSSTTRLTLEQYAQEVLSWRNSAGTWRIDWAASYDTIGDPERTEQDHHRLMHLLERYDHDPPIVPVSHYPRDSAHDVLADALNVLAMLDDHERDALETAGMYGVVDGPVDRPAWAIGGLVPTHYSNAATKWYDHLLRALESAEEIDVLRRRIHLFGIGKSSWTLRSSLVFSFDTSAPAQMAKFGYQKITSFRPEYGLSQEQLRNSRDARLAYWLIRYRDCAGMAWIPFTEHQLLRHDRRPAIPPSTTNIRQLTMFDQLQHAQAA